MQSIMTNTSALTSDDLDVADDDEDKENDDEIDDIVDLGANSEQPEDSETAAAKEEETKKKTPVWKKPEKKKKKGGSGGGKQKQKGKKKTNVNSNAAANEGGEQNAQVREYNWVIDDFMISELEQKCKSNDFSTLFFKMAIFLLKNLKKKIAKKFANKLLSFKECSKQIFLKMLKTFKIVVKWQKFAKMLVFFSSYTKKN